MNVQQINRASAAAIGFVIAIVFFVALTVAVKFAVKAPAIDADRAEVRAKALAEMHAEEAKLNTLAVADSQRGIIRLPVETAVRVAAEKWPTAAAARADLATRVAKATAIVKPVSFE